MSSQRLALLAFHARRLGWSGLAGAALGVVALAFYLSAGRETERQIAAVGAEIGTLRRQLRNAAPVVASPAQRQIETLQKFFPTRAALADSVDRIHEIAQKHGLTHASGEYKELRKELDKELAKAAGKEAGKAPDRAPATAVPASAPGDDRQPPDGQLQRYQLSLPLRGAYPDLRAWLADVMNAMPAVALDEFSLKRDKVDSPLVDARVRLTLYFEDR